MEHQSNGKTNFTRNVWDEDMVLVIAGAALQRKEFRRSWVVTHVLATVHYPRLRVRQYRIGAPRAMKMGTTESPWQHDTGERHTSKPAKWEWSAILRYKLRLEIGVERMNTIALLVEALSSRACGSRARWVWKKGS